MGQRLGAYQEAMLSALGYPPVDAFSAETRDGAINDSYFEVLSLFAHPELKADQAITTVDETKEYALPANYWYMRVVKDETNSQNLNWKSLEWIEAQDAGETGTPQWWTREGAHLRLWTTPDDEYTIRLWYMLRPPRLDDVTDASVLGSDWDELVKLGAIARGFFYLGELDRQVHTLNLWRSRLNRVVEVTDLERATGIEIAGPLNSEFEPRV